MKMLAILLKTLLSKSISTVLLSVTPVLALDFKVEEAKLSSYVNGVRDTVLLGDLRGTAIAVGSSEARATYIGAETANSFRFGISSHKLTFRGGKVVIANEGSLTFTLNEPAYYSFSGTNVWSGTTVENVAPQVSLSRVRSDATTDAIYLERDSILAQAGGFGIDGIAQGDVNFRHATGTNSGYLFPGTYRIEYAFSVSDQRQDFADNVEVNGWFSFDLQSERGAVADPLMKAIGLEYLASGGDRPWTATPLTGKDNGDSGRSGEIANGQQSWIKTSIPAAAILSFWWKISSQTNVDFLEVAFNSRPLRRISGSVGWQQVVLSLPMPALAANDITWTYSKGATGRAGEDAAWIDAVTITYIVPGGPIPPRLAQTIDFPQPTTPLDAPVELIGSASSGLPMIFEIVSGPALIHGSILIPTGNGSGVVRASQVGDGAFLPAQPVERTILIAAQPSRPLALDTPEMSVLVGDPDGRTIEAIAVQPDGKIIVGGYFSYVNGERRANIARFLPSGFLDRNWKPEIDGRGVMSLIITNNSLYVAGQFWNVNGIPRRSLAKISLDDIAVLDPLWNPAVNDVVFSMATVEDGLIIGGSFSSVAGRLHNFLAKVSLSGQGELDEFWKPGPDNTILKLAAFGTNAYFFGSFSNIGGFPISHLAKASALGTGAVDRNWRATIEPNRLVNALLPSDDGLYVGGDPLFNGTPGQSFALACLSPFDGKVLRLGYPDSTVTALSLHNDALFVGHGRDLTQPLSSHALDKVSPIDFRKDPSWNVPIISKPFPAAGYPGKIGAIAVERGDIIVGGDFRSVSGSPGAGLAVLPGFAGPPVVSNAITSVEQLTGVGVIVEPNPADLMETKFFRVSDIKHGTLFGLSLSRILRDGDVVELHEGRLGLRFLPEQGFSGTASFKVRAITGVTDLDISSPPAEALIIVLEKRYRQSITFGFLRDVPLNVGPIKLEAFASSGLPVLISVTGPAHLEGNDILRVTGLGEVVVIARQPGNEVYEPSLAVGQIFHVRTGGQTIQFLSPATAHVNIPLELNAIASSGLPVSFELLSGPAALSGSHLTFLQTGTVVVRATQAGSEEYAPAEFVDKVISVGKAAQTIAFSLSVSRPFNAGPFLLNAVASSGFPVSYRVLSGNAIVGGIFLRPQGAGLVMIEASQAGNDEFESVSVHRNFEFLRAGQSLSYNPIPGEVTIGQQFKVSAAASSGLPVTISIASGFAQFVDNVLTITSLGPLKLLYSQPGNENWEPAETTSDWIRAYPGKQTITWEPLADISFEKRSVPLTATSSSGLPVSYRVLFGPAIVSHTNLVFIGTGAVQVRAYQAGNALYELADGPIQAFTITKAAQSITFEPLTNLYSGGSYPLKATASSGLPVTFAISSGPAVVTSFNDLVVSSPGTIVVFARQNGDSNFYASEVSQTITATKSRQALEFEPIADQPWNAGSIPLNATSSSGLAVFFNLLSGPATLGTNVLHPAGVGEIVVRAVQPGNVAFESSEITQRFHLTKASQVVEFAPLPDIRFSDPAPKLRASTTSLLPAQFTVISGPVNISNDLASPIGLGTAVIEASQPGNELYESAPPVRQTFAISKGLQEIIFPAPVWLRIATPTRLEATASSGLPVEFGVLSGPGILSADILTPLGVGEVRVIAMQSGGENYEPAAPVERVLSVTKSSQTIQFKLPATALTSDGPLRLNASASSGLPVRYLVLSGPALPREGALIPVNAGTVVVRAIQGGDESFDPAPNEDRTITFVSAGPTLQIDKNPTVIFLSWPAIFTDYQLEVAASLKSAWKPSGANRELLQDSLRVQVLPAAEIMFYRLKQRQ
jgi:hypothetical protein